MTSKFCFTLGILIGNRRTRKKQIFFRLGYVRKMGHEEGKTRRKKHQAALLLTVCSLSPVIRYIKLGNCCQWQQRYFSNSITEREQKDRKKEQPHTVQLSHALDLLSAASGPPSVPSPFFICSLPSVLPLMFPSCHFRAAFPWPPPQPQLLSDTHCIALHMKMSCHIFQPLKQEIIFGRGGFDSSAL